MFYHSFSLFSLVNDVIHFNLYELEQYIRTHRLLPGIPSQSDVEQHGIDLATTTASLLQKIEELTLYIIQIQKEIYELKQQIQKN